MNQSLPLNKSFVAKDSFLPYLAGFFDGEGSVGIYPNTIGLHYLRVQIVQNDSPMIRDLFGYLLHRYGGNCSPQPSPSGKVKLTYQISSDPATALLNDMIPHLLLKREQAEVAVEWQTRIKQKVTDRDSRGRIKPHERREVDKQYADRLKILKKTGEEIGRNESSIH